MRNEKTNEEQVMDWVSVKDRLPPHADYHNCRRYLIFCDYFCLAYWYEGRWVNDSDEPRFEYTPTHWCELVEPSVSVDLESIKYLRFEWGGSLRGFSSDGRIVNCADELNRMEKERHKE